MKFSGQLKFPEIDHPGVPVHFVIEGAQAELIVEGESLGRWSLYDIHARRLVASAFQIDLEGTEVTFVADDPVDFAYRGVEHMAETWASMKTKRMAGRTIAVRKSRQGTIPSRVAEMRAAMEANLETQAVPRELAGQQAMPEGGDAAPPDSAPRTEGGDWDHRDTLASIPLVGSEATPQVPGSEEPMAPAETPAPDPALAEELARLDDEKRRIAEERARLEEQRRIAEQREADRIEAFRLEMQRLEAEREELRRQISEVMEEKTSPTPPWVLNEEAMLSPESDSVFAPEHPVEPEAVDDEEPVAPADPEPESSDVGQPPVEADLELTRDAGVVDLNDLEAPGPTSPRLPDPRPPSPRSEPPAPRPVSTQPRQPEPEPVMAGAGRDSKTGLMGAVKAAFRSGPKDHEHQFIEAPGGIGITRYVCEECGFVSISV